MTAPPVPVCTVPDPDPNRVHDLHTDDLITPAGNRYVGPEMLGELLPSMRQVGQQIPGIVFPHPEIAGKYIVAAGNRRQLACRILGLKFKAVIFPRAPSDVDLIRIRLTENVIRQSMSADEIANDILIYMQSTGSTQHMAAEFFGLSPGYVSKLHAPLKKLLPELKLLADNPAVPRDVLRIVATMATPELQKKLAERVLADVAREGRANRDAIQMAADEMKSGKKTTQRPLVIKQDGLVLTAKKPSAEAMRALIEKLSAAIKRVKGGDDLADLPFHFRAT